MNRRIHKAYNRVRDGNFALDGLVGFDLAGKTVGVVGTGRIGALVARLAWHFRCEVVAHDPIVDQRLVELGIGYVGLDELWERSHVVTLNCPLTADTHHLVSADVIARMRPGVMLVNTGRGALIDTLAVIDGLKTGQIGSLALDVYEEEAELFFEDRSAEIIGDDVFARLLTFPNVLITAHQAFLTREALDAIAATTLANLDCLAAGEHVPEPPRVTGTGRSDPSALPSGQRSFRPADDLVAEDERRAASAPPRRRSPPVPSASCRAAGRRARSTRAAVRGPS